MITSLRNYRYYRFIIWVGLAICMLLIFWRGSLIVTTPEWLQIDDYVEYWAAGQLNLNEGNPYDPDQLLPLQLQAGRSFGVPVMMWNPPWMLVLAMPFCIVEYAASRTLWIVFFVIIIFISANQTWLLYGGSMETRWISWLLGFTFVPILQAIRTGQTGPLLLLGVVGFLYFMRNNKPLLAGASLSLLAVKPHVLYLFALAIILWCINQEQWRVILGTVITLLTATLIAWIINPSVIQQYLYAATHYPPSDWATPTLGGITRYILGTEYFWMQFVPPVAGIFWLVVYWIRNKDSWNWIEETPLLILVSIFTAAYGWTSDQSVSLIAVLQIIILIVPGLRNLSHVLILTTYLFVNVLLGINQGNQLWLWWFAPALLVWHLGSKWFIENKQRFNNTVKIS